MPSEVVLKLDIVVLLLSVFIDKHSFEVVSEKACVGGQIKLELSEDQKEKKTIYVNPNMMTWLLSIP